MAAARSKVREWAGSIAFFGGAYLLVNTFLYQGFYVPSESMLPTLTVGDQFYAAKYAYGYSRFSTPFVPLPVGSGRVAGNLPARGDIVVFRKARDETDLVKRVVGLPGDRLQWVDGRLYINGVLVAREKTRDITYRAHSGAVTHATEYLETLPGGRTHLILEQTDSGMADNTPEYVVPDGHLFMAGDNRDNSGDSRFLNDVGYVPLERVLGRVGTVAFTRNGCSAEEGLTCPGGGWWDRFFRSVAGT
ncbi:signal peptidase I [Niveispirillum sp.]|uniref:signal peptidase I n=1 Tax=Niveispirillum sp. TaxID=1917217 RepID=UPI001B691163|nr:signal peptidase I [Niveispirillum sp.]MBP7336584.1 signal peptidase I [Niveispirillum sp.]